MFYSASSDDVVFYLSKKMTEIISIDLLAGFRMTFAASRCVAEFSRSPGGGERAGIAHPPRLYEVGSDPREQPRTTSIASADGNLIGKIAGNQ